MSVYGDAQERRVLGVKAELKKETIGICLWLGQETNSHWRFVLLFLFFWFFCEIR